MLLQFTTHNKSKYVDSTAPLYIQVKNHKNDLALKGTSDNWQKPKNQNQTPRSSNWGRLRDQKNY